MMVKGFFYEATFPLAYSSFGSCILPTVFSVCSKRRLDGGEQYQFEYNAFVSFFGFFAATATGDVLLRIYILHWDVK